MEQDFGMFIKKEDGLHPHPQDMNTTTSTDNGNNNNNDFSMFIKKEGNLSSHQQGVATSTTTNNNLNNSNNFDMYIKKEEDLHSHAHVQPHSQPHHSHPQGIVTDNNNSNPMGETTNMIHQQAQPTHPTMSSSPGAPLNVVTNSVVQAPSPANAPVPMPVSVPMPVPVHVTIPGVGTAHSHAHTPTHNAVDVDVAMGILPMQHPHQHQPPPPNASVNNNNNNVSPTLVKSMRTGPLTTRSGSGTPRHRWTKEQKEELYWCYCYAKYTNNLPLTKGTYEVWRNRNRTLCPQMNAVKLSNQRRHDEKLLSAHEKEAISRDAQKIVATAVSSHAPHVQGGALNGHAPGANGLSEVSTAARGIRHRWTKEQKKELYWCYCYAKYTNNLPLTKGTYEVWRNRNGALCPQMNAVTLSNQRRYVEKSLDPNDKEAIARDAQHAAEKVNPPPPPVDTVMTTVATMGTGTPTAAINSNVNDAMMDMNPVSVSTPTTMPTNQHMHTHAHTHSHTTTGVVPVISAPPS